MKDVFCRRSFHEDGDEYWSEGCYYELVDANDEGAHIRTNFDGVGYLEWEDFQEYFNQDV